LAVNRKWLIPVVIIGAILLLIVVPLMSSYNSLVTKEEGVNQSFSDLDGQLQRRNDLVPNLVSAVRAALRQEQAVFGEIARARQGYAGAQTPAQKAEADASMSSALSRLLVVVESYPQLQSNRNIQDLMTQLEGTENRIVQARRDYNRTATDYNVTIRRFPRSLIAGMFGFDRKPLFNAEPASRENPNVGDGLDDAFTPSPTSR
jgi:LemA protein